MSGGPWVKIECVCGRSFSVRDSNKLVYCPECQREYSLTPSGAAMPTDGSSPAWTEVQNEEEEDGDGELDLVDLFERNQ